MSAAELQLTRASVFFHSQVGDPQLNHPEGVVIGPDGNVWCGGTGGEIYRLPPDGSRLDVVAQGGGYSLGMAFDRDRYLYVCDLKHRAVMRYDPGCGEYRPWAMPKSGRPMVAPNFPVVDHKRKCLYVSDSHVAHRPGMGIWRVDLDTAKVEPWWEGPLDFANGLAYDSEADILYVAETWGRRVTAIDIGHDGSAARARTHVAGLDGLVDGLALDGEQSLWLSFYAPSKIMRADRDGRLELVIHDPLCDVLCHPTNIAFLGTALIAANLGGHHLTRIDVGVEGLSLL